MSDQKENDEWDFLKELQESLNKERAADTEETRVHMNMLYLLESEQLSLEACNMMHIAQELCQQIDGLEAQLAVTIAAATVSALLSNTKAIQEQTNVMTIINHLTPRIITAYRAQVEREDKEDNSADEEMP